jgi:thiosulfate/3-mercaptopyruvate sulfurtransferase
MTEQAIQEKGYAHPEALVTTEWVQEHLDDTENVRIVESDEDVLLYDIGHVPNAVKIDWVEDLNDPLMRDYLDPEKFAALMSEKVPRQRSCSTGTGTTGGQPMLCGFSGSSGTTTSR